MITFREWFKFKKIRLLLAWGAIPILILSSRMNDWTFRWGIVILVAGELVRLWALGYMERKGKQLAMSGPYAFVRNPLYIGNFILGLGVAFIVANWFVFFIFILVFWIAYAATIRDEERHLREKFGKSFEDYCRNVPAFIPRLTPYRSTERDSFLWSRIIKHHEYITVLGITLMVLLIRLYDELILEKESFAHEKPLIVAALIVILLLVVERLFVSRIHINFFERLRAKFFPPKKS
jgi:protein-S-isoprenylcysteine O-methyltransferase Ste14